MSLSYLFGFCFSHASRVGRTRNNDVDVVSPESPSPQYVTAFNTYAQALTSLYLANPLLHIRSIPRPHLRSVLLVCEYY